MRIVIVMLLVASMCAPAFARRHKRTRAHASPTPVMHVVPNDRAAQEHARAEAELADLRAGRVSDEQAAPSEPAQVWAVQEDDKEVPSNLRKK